MVRSLAFLLVLTSASMALAEEPVVGSGKTDTETRKLAAFDKIEFRIAGDFDVAIGKASPLEIVADDNILPLITTEVKDGRLIVSAERQFKSKRSPKFSVTVPDLAAVKILGAADMNVRGIDNKKLSVDVKGAADVRLKGRTAALSVIIDGAGDVFAYDLDARVVSVSIGGSGDAKVNANDALNVSIAGNGDVTYAGNPTISQMIAGKGDVKRRR